MLDSSLNCIVDKDGKFVLWLANVRAAIDVPRDMDKKAAEERISAYLQELGYKNGPYRLCAFEDVKPSEG